MHRTISKIAYHEGYTVAVAFERFLDWVIHGFCSKALRGFSYNEYENEVFLELLGELSRITNDAIKAKGGGHSTFDALSELYETHIIANGEKANNAQYHTPSHVAALCAELASASGQPRIYEPCCGSGRMLLAAAQRHPGVPVLGEELDPLSAKMCVCNILINGIEGTIVCRDVLDRTKAPRFGYKINEGIRNPSSMWFGLPHIEQIA